LKKGEDMPYDSNLDEQVFTKSFDKDGQRIVVSVHSYNKGPKKLQIIREAQDAEGNSRFAKLGRLSKDEAQGILPIIQEAMGSM
jgi:predicted transcriptional regulator